MTALLKLARIADQVLDEGPTFGLKPVTINQQGTYVPSTEYDFRFVFEDTVDELLFSQKPESVLDYALFLGIESKECEVIFHSRISELPSANFYPFKIQICREGVITPEKFVAQALIGQANVSYYLKDNDGTLVENPALSMQRLFAGRVLDHWTEDLMRLITEDQLNQSEFAKLAVYRLAYDNLSHAAIGIIESLPADFVNETFSYAMTLTRENTANYNLDFLPVELRGKIRNNLAMIGELTRNTRKC
jgi:hypothetical protein